MQKHDIQQKKHFCHAMLFSHKRQGSAMLSSMLLSLLNVLNEVSESDG